jgi:hypothetical protein
MSISCCRVRDHENILPVFERTEDGRHVWRLGGKVLRCFAVGYRLLLVARCAGLIADIPGASWIDRRLVSA